MLKERYANPEDLNEARLRMARIPHGADLIENPISKAPGFMAENVIVMAGVPAIMQAMLEGVMPKLKVGKTMLSVSIDSGGLPEGAYATGLGEVQKAHAGVIIGSYPHFDGQRFINQIVLRSRDEALLEKAKMAVSDLISQLKSNAV